MTLPSPSELLRAYGRPAKKSLGQNFLTNPAILDRIVALAQPLDRVPGCRVLEIGPGPGGLTSRLLAAGADVTAIEPDRDAVAHLEATLVPVAPLKLLCADALRIDLGELLGAPAATVVANLPYHVATEILMRFVDRDEGPERMVLMFQREVAERIVAPGRCREFSALTVAVQTRYAARIGMSLPPGAFTPAPKVRSAVVVLDRRGDGPDAALREATLRASRAAFSQRRKQIHNTLAQVSDDVAGVLAEAGVSPTARPEELDVAAFVALGRALRARA